MIPIVYFWRNFLTCHQITLNPDLSPNNSLFLVCHRFLPYELGTKLTRIIQGKNADVFLSLFYICIKLRVRIQSMLRVTKAIKL